LLSVLAVLPALKTMELIQLALAIPQLVVGVDLLVVGEMSELAVDLVAAKLELVVAAHIQTLRLEHLVKEMLEEIAQTITLIEMAAAAALALLEETVLALEIPGAVVTAFNTL
jgi:hypothetical protein